MAVSMVTRFVNVRNLMNINNFSAAGHVAPIIQHLDVTSKSYSTKFIDNKNIDSLTYVPEKKAPKKLSKAMAAYLQRSRDYKKFLEKEVAEYDIGKRHLANMMGEDPDKFTEKDISNAIKYLFPSGLYDKEARPMMIHPDKLYAARKEAEFDESGRPHHYLFYTTKPNFYDILHNIAESFNYLNKMEDKKLGMHMLPTPQDKIDLTGSEWFPKKELESTIIEKLSDAEYAYFITSMERLSAHPLSVHVTPFIEKYKRKLTSMTIDEKFPEPQYDSNNRPFILVDKCMRKSSRGTVKVIGNGSGHITINGRDITYFDNVQCREQVIFPLIFTNMYDKVDVEATVNGGGPTGQAGVIRWGIAMALRSFTTVEIAEKMRLAGLLTYDWRRRERKKWGQEGARRKFTWKKR
ncbi:mitochondrial ribosomal protein S9 [Xylocopa sonorina]|uniref:mitochondrial ribosomal protein S9 n=1 Tax=Xylocopa sonorina TaxID=1818115 RepID=UPI00403AD0AE